MVKLLMRVTWSAGLDADPLIGDERRQRVLAHTCACRVKVAAARHEHHVQALIVSEREVLPTNTYMNT
jgi:hypothetical protein